MHALECRRFFSSNNNNFVDARFAVGTVEVIGISSSSNLSSWNSTVLGPLLILLGNWGSGGVTGKLLGCQGIWKSYLWNVRGPFGNQAKISVYATTKVGSHLCHLHPSSTSTSTSIPLKPNECFKSGIHIKMKHLFSFFFFFFHQLLSTIKY